MEGRYQNYDAETIRAAESCTVCWNIRTVLTEPGHDLDLGSLDDLVATPCPGHDAESCTLCRARKELLIDSGHNMDFRSLEDLIRNKPCPGHDAFLSWLMGMYRYHRDAFDMRMPSLALRSHDGVGGSLKLRDYKGKEIVGWDFVLDHPFTNASMTGWGRQLDSSWADMDLLRRWKDECLTKHGNLCCNPFKVRPAHPAWLIDIVDDCLVLGDGIDDYVALSYRWGSTACLQTELSILSALQQKGALSKRKFAKLISPMVKHAAKLISVLGERYLWADALCIVQNDNEQTAQQLLLMGAIYASAKFTIIATDGDSGAGIPGLRGVSQPRSLYQITFPLGVKDRMILQKKPILRNISGNSPYFSRAWTFQEFVLSKRRLIVRNGQFHWTCSAATFHEDLYGMDYQSREKATRFQPPEILCGIPSFKELGPILGEFNSRNLTRDEDALAAASGILTILGRSFDRGFIYGLPEMCFDSALMWSQYLTPKSMQRRVHSRKNHCILPGSQLPSWSWLGWKAGGLEAVVENSGELFDMRPFTTCITQWYNHETPHSGKKSVIRPKFLEHGGHFNKKRLDTDLASRHGWSKEMFDPQKHNNSWTSRGKPLLKLGDSVYSHQRLPGRLYWFPFPIMDISDQSAMDGRPQYPFLSCKTKRGFFQAKKAHPLHKSKGFGQLQILQHGQNICGFLHVNSMEYAVEFPAIDSTGGTTVELVAICRKKWPSINAYNQHNTIVEDPEFDERYGCLWIEWSEGIAYRKGHGYIETDIWKGHDLEDIDLVLG